MRIAKCGDQLLGFQRGMEVGRLFALGFDCLDAGEKVAFTAYGEEIAVFFRELFRQKVQVPIPVDVPGLGIDRQRQNSTNQ